MLNTELHCVVKLVTSNVCGAQGCEQNSLYYVPYLLCTLGCLNFWWPCSIRWRFWLDSSSKSFHGLLFPENVSHLSLIHSTMGSFFIHILRITFWVLTTCLWRLASLHTEASKPIWASEKKCSQCELLSTKDMYGVLGAQRFSTFPFPVFLLIWLLQGQSKLT